MLIRGSRICGTSSLSTHRSRLRSLLGRVRSKFSLRSGRVSHVLPAPWIVEDSSHDHLRPSFQSPIVSYGSKAHTLSTALGDQQQYPDDEPKNEFCTEPWSVPTIAGDPDPQSDPRVTPWTLYEPRVNGLLAKLTRGRWATVKKSHFWMVDPEPLVPPISPPPSRFPNESSGLYKDPWLHNHPESQRLDTPLPAYAQKNPNPEDPKTPIARPPTDMSLSSFFDVNNKTPGSFGSELGKALDRAFERRFTDWPTTSECSRCRHPADNTAYHHLHHYPPQLVGALQRDWYHPDPEWGDPGIDMASLLTDTAACRNCTVDRFSGSPDLPPLVTIPATLLSELVRSVIAWKSKWEVERRHSVFLG